MVEDRCHDPGRVPVLWLHALAEVHAIEHERAQRQHRVADRLALHDLPGAAGLLDDVVDERVDAGRAGGPEQLDLLGGQVVVVEDPVADRIVDVVVDVRDTVDEPHDLALQRGGLLRARVREDAVAHLVGEVQVAGDAVGLLVVPEAPPETRVERVVERLLPGVAERRVARVVPEADRLDEVLVQAQRSRDDAGDRRGLERVRHSRPVVVAEWVDEDLRLSLQAAERLGVHQAVAVALKRGADAAGLLWTVATAGGVRPHRKGREGARLLLADTLLEPLGRPARRLHPVSVDADPARHWRYARLVTPRAWTRALALAAVIVLAGVASACSSTSAVDEGPFAYDQGQGLDVLDLGIVDADYPLAVHDISYVSGGRRIEAYLVVPPGTGPWPATVYVHGAGADRRSMLAPATWLAARGAVTLTISAPSAEAESPDGTTALERLEAHRRLEVGDVVAVRRALDLLSERDDVDADRLAYVGWSAGARAGAILAGVEPRLRSLVLLAPGSAAVAEFVAAAPPEERGVVEEVMSSVDPLAYIARGRGDGILIQDGDQDLVIPRTALDAVIEAAPEGTDVRWYEAGHEVGFQAYREHLDWLQEQLGIDGPRVPGAQAGPDPNA